MYVDTHCHLNYHEFQVDLPEVLDRARKAAVSKIMVPGFTLQSSQDAVRLAITEPDCWAAAGIHPNDALEWNIDTENLLRHLLQQSRVLAVGEIGLDYYRDHAAHDIQQVALKEQLALAAEFGKPVIIHIRESIDDTFSILFEWQQELARVGSPLAQHPGIFHSFPGTMEEAQHAVRHHFKIGVGGPVTFKNAHQKHKLVESLPFEAIVLETDAPFLTPHPHRGRRNEPSYIPWIGEKVSELKGVTLEQVAAQTSVNAHVVFGW
ncbi:MAG: TatD family hydrolase [Anaerolineae bacterium]|nr:TatD family hydrolase [Anaerolineae bacterium]